MHRASHKSSIRLQPLVALLAVGLSLTASARPAAAQGYTGLQIIGDHYFDAPQSGTNLGGGVRAGSNGFGDNTHWSFAFSANFLAQEINAPAGPTRSSYFDMTASIQWSPVEQAEGWWPYVGVGYGWMMTTREGGQVGPLGGTSVPLSVGARLPSSLFVELQYWGKMPEQSVLGERKSTRVALALGFTLLD
ncbi:MAG: outer membrane beta-barrel protein [Longimicrobiales bacterium]